MIITSGYVGGCEHSSVRIANWLTDAGHSVRVLYPDIHELAPALKAFKKAGATLKVIRLDISGYGRLRMLLRMGRNFAATYWALIRYRPNIVIFNLPEPKRALGSRLACAIRKTPALVRFALISNVSWGKLRHLYRWTLAREQTWFTVCHQNARLLEESLGLAPGSVKTLPNPFPAHISGNNISHARARQWLQEASNIPDNAIVITTVGALIDRKGHRLVLQAAKALCRTYENVHFVWAGQGPLSDQLKSEIHRQKLAEKIHMLGEVDEVGRILKASNLFLFSTYAEGQPNALLEAIACRLPIVSSDASGIGEIISHKYNGLLFYTGDAEDLIEKVSYALENPQQMQKFAWQAYEELKNYDEKRIKNQLLKLLPSR